MFVNIFDRAFEFGELFIYEFRCWELVGTLVLGIIKPNSRESEVYNTSYTTTGENNSIILGSKDNLELLCWEQS